MIHFKCPSCGKSIKVGDAGAGKAGKCPSCGATVHVPHRPPAPALTDDDVLAALGNPTTQQPTEEPSGEELPQFYEAPVAAKRDQRTAVMMHEVPVSTDMPKEEEPLTEVPQSHSVSRVAEPDKQGTGQSKISPTAALMLLGSLVLFALLLYALKSGWFGRFGTADKSPKPTETSARHALTAELDEWLAGEVSSTTPTEHFSLSGSKLILTIRAPISYEILTIRPVVEIPKKTTLETYINGSELYNPSLGPSYRAVVKLHLISQADTELTKIYEYALFWYVSDIQDGRWLIEKR